MATKDPRDFLAEFGRIVEEGAVEALDAVCDPQILTHSFGPPMP